MYTMHWKETFLKVAHHCMPKCLSSLRITKRTIYICNGSCHSIGQMAHVNKGGIEIYLKIMIIITAYSHMAYSDCQWNMFDKKNWQIVMASKYGQTYPHRHCHGKIVFPIHHQQWHVHRQWHIMRTKYINE